MKLSQKEKDDIKGYIQKAELKSSAEIRVYLEKKCPGEVLDRASFLFKELKMHKTVERNGVLIYLAHEDHLFAIIGDSGIHSKVGDHYWQSVKEEMLELFKIGKIKDGLCLGVNRVGIELAKYFPRSKGDVNELSDDVIEIN